MAAGTDRVSMRKGCAPLMMELGRDTPNLVAMGADGLSLYTEFAKEFPERFIDVGIAEANLIGVASGLARAGKRVFIGTIASFLVRRACEQIRLDVCDPGLDVCMVGIGGGLSYGRLGPTHHIPEDFAILSTMPNVALLCPADVHEARWALRVAVQWQGPIYIRMGAREDPVIHDQEPALAVASLGLVLRRGADVVILASGICVGQALQAAARLESRGIHVGVVSVPVISPFRPSALFELIDGYRAVVVVEEHLRQGGLGARVLEACWKRSQDIVHLGISPSYAGVGTREELMRHYEIDADAILHAVQSLLQEGAP